MHAMAETDQAARAGRGIAIRGKGSVWFRGPACGRRMAARGACPPSGQGGNPRDMALFRQYGMGRENDRDRLSFSALTCAPAGGIRRDRLRIEVVFGGV
ncbi:hypothetical protein CFR72_08395 [Gluconacetobacter entanii]|uniref:Uncharacterized protein n=1 Tax=Gluconacetobacter entanii TaxID=108528 RepID=A0A318PXW7_9PROT|nr:hypothetical protein CFR72_08395 [Gluconacetobacter entanii]